jgi:iron-sulfur cluster assembly protein
MLTVTPVAVEKLKDVLKEQAERQASLRVIAAPAQHGGVQYMLTLEKELQQDDQSLDISGVKFIVDSYSAPYVEDATIDYIEEMHRVGFTISNPKYASGGCGCGGNCSCGGH